MTDIDSLLRSDLRGQKPYGAPQLEVDVALNTNENSHPLPDSVRIHIEVHLADAVRDLNRYPDRNAVELRRQLASYLGHDLTTDQVWAANGSNEVLQQLLQAFGGPGRRAVGFGPSYSMHPILTRTSGTEWIDGRRLDHFAITPTHVTDVIDEHDPDIVFLCSPNNPTGTALSPEVISTAIDCSRGVVIVDEAYAEFARDDSTTALKLLAEHPRLVVTRTMSKAFGLAGARVGYLAAHPEVVAALFLVRLPYHLSSLTQAAALGALAGTKHLLATVDDIRGQRDRIVSQLRQRGLPVADSDANFVLFGGMLDASAVWQALLDQGVLIRDVGIPGWLRVTAGTDAEVTAFLQAVAVVQSQRRELFAHNPEEAS